MGFLCKGDCVCIHGKNRCLIYLGCPNFINISVTSKTLGNMNNEGAKRLVKCFESDLQFTQTVCENGQWKGANCNGTSSIYNNINWRYVQRKNVVNNVDMSSLRAPWQSGPYKNLFVSVFRMFISLYFLFIIS